MLIREASAADAFGIARVHVDAWRAAYQGLMPQNVLDSLSMDEISERWGRMITEPEPSSRLLVAERDGVVLGWSSFGPAREKDAPANGELWGIYTHPECWSTGVGRALLAAVEEGFRNAGYDHAYLWVLDGNDRAVRFYERNQWASDGALKVDERPGMSLRERRHVKLLVSAIDRE